MKVLILTTVMAPYRVQLFNEIGKNCELCVCFEQKRASERDDKWYDTGAYNFELIPLKGWDGGVSKLKFDIIKQIRCFDPDVAIAYEYSTPTAMLFMTLCKVKKIPYIINCDGGFVTKSYKDVVKRFFIKNASALIASGEMAKKYFLHYGALKKQIYFNNFTSLHETDILKSPVTREEKQLYKEKNNITEKKVILAVGRFIHSKGFDVLLDALLEIEKGVGVYFVGGKPTEDYINFVDENGLNNVHFVDFIVPEKLNEYFIAADLFVLPTREDVWGLVVNEAMAKGLPVVTTDRCIAGIELIENGVNGYIVPVEDSEALAVAMNKILSDEDLQEKMAKNNLKKIQDYTYEQSAKMIYEIINKVKKKV